MHRDIVRVLTVLNTNAVFFYTAQLSFSVYFLNFNL